MIASGPVLGSIVRGKLIPASSYVYVTFTSGANIKVVDGYTNTVNNFSFTVPTLTGATATICVQEGPIYDLPFAIVHKNDLVANQANVPIAIPDPAVLALPLQNTTG